MENQDLHHQDKKLESLRFGDIYYNKENGLEETRYVFLDGNGLYDRIFPHPLVVCETGFGTGLNFLTLWRDFQLGKIKAPELIFQSVELYPISRADLEEIHQDWPELAGVSQMFLQQWKASKGCDFRGHWPEERVRIQVVQREAQEGIPLLEEQGDAWFLDGFDPGKNPQLWNPAIYRLLFQKAKEGATLATFTAKGDVRRGLASAGFSINKRKGYGYKRHMTQGIKPSVQ